MTDANLLAAEILETSAAGYASAAVVRLGDLGSGSTADWKAHVTQRILELAAAVRVDDPGLFARRIKWLRRAVKARGADERELRAALKCLSAALAEELPEGVRSTVEKPIDMALDALDTTVEPEANALDAATPEGKLGLQYLTACLEARAGDAVNLILDALDSTTTPEDVYLKVIVPAQREIGQLWHAGDATVAEERLVSETTRDIMALIVNRFAPKLDNGRTLLAASVAGNAHDLGLRVAADLFRLAGWRAICLGASMPTADIARAAQIFGADLVLLTATLTPQINTVAAAIDRVRGVSSGSKILIGGQAFDGSPELWKQLGADAYAAEIGAAVSIGEALVRTTQ